MEISKKWIDAVDKRTSRRTYIDKEIDDIDILELLKVIDKINKENSLNIQFIKKCKDGLNGFKASYGMISGAKSFIALVGDVNIENIKQKVGYFGEILALEATSLGLGSCWVGGTYDKSKCQKQIKLSENEEVFCIIVLGHTPKDLSIKEKVVKMINKKPKMIEDILVSKQNDIYSWMESGLEFSLKAPTALNKQEIIYKINQDKVYAMISGKNYGYEEIDLGISMLHFELGAYSEGYKGSWHYQNKEYIFY